MRSALATKPDAGDVDVHEDRRRHQRYQVSISATLHSGGKSQPTTINDLSAGGVGLSSAIGIFADDDVEIELAGGRRIAGSVAWWLAGCCGVQFHKPLKADDALLTAACHKA